MDRVARIGTVGGLMAGATIVFAWLVRPFDGGPAASDAASSVLYFDRIVSGRTLEAWVNTTPKPLLTLVYGVLHAIDPGWGLVSFSSVLAAGAAVVLAAELGRRLAGLPAAAFVATGLLGSLAMGAESSWSYALPWALAFWSAAALMLLRPSPQPAAAGGFLLLAGLARPETFIALAVGALVLAFATVRGRRPPPRMWLVMLGWLALPLMCLHDVLLTGNPLWWLAVAPHAVEVNGGRARSFRGTLSLSWTIVSAMWPQVVLAIPGGLLLVARRAWVPVVGLVSFGPLVIVYTWALAARRLTVIPHYYDPVKVATIVAAGVAVGAGLAWIRRRLEGGGRRELGSPGRAVLVAVAVVVAVVASRPFSPLSPAARSTIGLEGRLDARVAALLPVIRQALPARTADPTPAVGPMGRPDDASVVLFIPRHELPRMAVDLDLALTRLDVIDPSRIDLAAGYPPVDSVVYLDGLIDSGSVGPATAVLRQAAAVTVGGIEVLPIHVDPANRIWIVAIRRAP